MASQESPLSLGSSPSMVQPTLDNTIGACFIGVVVASVLFGISCLQAYLYYHYWYRDSVHHRIAVGLLWLLDALHLALTCHAVYHYSITSFGMVLNLLQVVWSIPLQISINVVIIVLVQSLYAYRVWLLSGYHRGILGYLAVSIVGAGFAVGIILAYKVYRIKTWTQLPDIAWVVNAALAASTSIDFVLAGAMCYYLSKSKGQTTSLNSRISHVMQYTLSSGLLTSACSLSALFTHIFLANTMVFFAIESLLTKIYVVSFLTMLNARDRNIHMDKLDSESWGASSSCASMPRFARMPSRISSKRNSSMRDLMSVTTPSVDRSTHRLHAGSEATSLYSHYTEVSPIQPEDFTSFPFPGPAKLPRIRTTELGSPTTPSQRSSHPFAEKW